jgi:hypothetical protein
MISLKLKVELSWIPNNTNIEKVELVPKQAISSVEFAFCRYNSCDYNKTDKEKIERLIVAKKPSGVNPFYYLLSDEEVKNILGIQIS